MAPFSSTRVARTTVLAVLGLLCSVHTAQAAPDEAAVQAAFVLNFAKFTDWPLAGQPARQGAMQLCQFGVREELTQAFRSLEGRPLQGVPIQWRKVQRLDEVRGCHVLFMAEAGLSLSALGGTPVLTVSDLPGFVQQGGVIGLLRQGGRMRFEVNRGVAQTMGLRLSVDLLSLAMNVLDSTPRREGAL